MTARAANPTSLFPPPASVDDVVAIVRQAAAEGTPLRIVGRGRWLDAGRPVDRRATPLRLESLSGIIEYNPGDLTLTALAGTPLSEIERATSVHGQWLTLDPFGASDGSLGATVATASAGPLAGALGLPRDVVLGVEMVTGTGEIVHGGGRVVKNVAGFDLTRLAVGAWGTLGVLTTVTVRLRAVPAVEASVAISLGSGDRSLGALAERLRTAAVAPIAIEALSANLAARLGLDASPVLVMRLAGNSESVDAQRRTMASMADALDVAPAIWPALATSEPEVASVVRLSALPAQIADTWTAALAIVDVIDGGMAHASLARGVARCILPTLESNEVARALSRTSLAAARIFERLPQDLWPSLAPSAVQDRLSRGVKRAFDPHDLLNPGVLGAFE